MKIGDKREALMDAALELFVKHGIDRSATAAISRHAGVSTGVLFHYFDSKEALIRALFLRTKLAFMTCTYAVLREHSARGVRDTVRRLWEDGWRWMVANPLLFQFMEQYHHSAYMEEVCLDPAVQEWEHLLEGFLEFGRESGVFYAIDGAYLRVSCYKMMVAVAERVIKEPDVGRVEDFVEAAWEMFARMILR